MTEQPQTKREWKWVLILGAAFLAGLATTYATATGRAQPYQGVFRLEVVAVAAPVSGILTSLDRPHGESVRPEEVVAHLERIGAERELTELEHRAAGLQQKLATAEDQLAMSLILQNEKIETDRLETQLRYADLLRSRLDLEIRQKALRDRQPTGPSVITTSNGPAADRVAEDPLTSYRLELAESVNQYEVLQAQIQLCEDRLAGLEALQKRLPETLSNSLGIARMKSEHAELEKRQAELKSIQQTSPVLSPAHGQVGIWRCEAGEYVAEGQTVVEIFDSQRPYVLLDVPVSELLDLTIGRKVRVEFEGVSTERSLSGVVSRISSEAERNAEAAAAPGAVTASIAITPIERLWPIPPIGTTARVFLK